MSTDFNDSDTDNDRLSDGEELGQFVNVSADGTRITNKDELPDGLAIPEGTTLTQGSYYRLQSNPVETDTDSDGLSDFEEVREERPVAYTKTAAATDNVLDALRNDEQPEFSTDEGVFSDPYFADSDADGLNDLAETRQRTNPQERDTDDDGLVDGEEFALGEDPSLYDTTPPSIEIAAIEANRIADQDGETFDAFDVRYTVRFRVTDPSGVTEVRVFKAGEAGVRFTGDDVPTERLETTSFVAQSFATFLAETSLGPQVQIRAEDANGNVKTTAQRGPNAFARAAAVIDDLGGERLLPAELQKLGAIGTLAAFSGFTYYISSTVDQAVSGVKFAVDVFRGEAELPLSQFAETVGLLIDRPEVLLSIPGAILDSARRAQALQNPFPPAEFPDPGDPLEFDVDNTTFATGWYAGGLLGIAAEAYVTAGVGSAASAAGRGLPIVGRAIRAGETASAFLARGVGVAKQGALLTGRAVARGTGLALDAVTDALGRVSVAKQAIISRIVRDERHRDGPARPGQRCGDDRLERGGQRHRRREGDVRESDATAVRPAAHRCESVHERYGRRRADRRVRTDRARALIQ